jgi:hypothetical protein
MALRRLTDSTTAIPRWRLTRWRATANAVRILDGVDEYLFMGSELRLALEAQAQKMREAVEAEPEENLKQADPVEWAAALAHHLAVAWPELKTDEVWMEEPRPVKIDVSRAGEVIDPDAPARRQGEDVHPRRARSTAGAVLAGDACRRQAA